jgi:ferritin-like metal-binding protein YciE
LIAEGESYVKASGDRDVRDAGLIGAAQRVEHYEISGYGTTRTLALRLGESQAADKLQATLDEEAAADRKLTAIAEGPSQRGSRDYLSIIALIRLTEPSNYNSRYVISCA